MKFKPEWVAAVRINQNASHSLSTAIIHPDVLTDHLRHRRYALLADFANIVVNEGCLSRPTCVFKGLNRPLHSEGYDNFVFIYVCKPSYSYIFTKQHASAETRLAPAHSVFVTYVTLSRAMMTEIHETILAPTGSFRGIILGWEWVTECPQTPGLPKDHQKRYKGRLWK